MAKYIAFHLPQYHSFPENDEWWGKGFTDWVNVKKARPLFKGHEQPVVPLNENYYDMMAFETRKWQAELGKKYGLYGFCYYHYYFNGKLLMEKPLEALLCEKNIDFPFCLCWANEPWTRAWDGSTSQVIMPQNYGDESDWQKHVDYLMPFFKDSRYIKVEGKPLFVIYRTNNIPNCDWMIEFFNKKCIDEGFAGIYICEELNAFQREPSCKNSSAVIAFEPSNIQRDRSKWNKICNLFKSKCYTRNIRSGLKIFNYDEIWNKILHQKYITYGKKLFLGAFTGWDNSPRKKDRGMVYVGSTPHKFEQYLRKLNLRADEEHSEFIFINAWNEWAEGAYLEPDTRYSYEYLQALQNSGRGEKDEQ